jgi:cytidine deaminase
MAKKIDFKFHYSEYQSLEELPVGFKELAIKAMQAIDSSYSPYSQFAVGAAVQLENGQIVMGSNQENGAYPSGLCAERVALFYAGAAFPKVRVTSIAIAASHLGKPIAEPVSPCGGCRQVMIETQNLGGKPFTVIMVGEKRIVVVEDVRFLLPFTFSNILDAIKE